jgi:hypothetical protein
MREFVSECDRMAGEYGKRFTVSQWLRERAEANQPFHD